MFSGNLVIFVQYIWSFIKLGTMWKEQADQERGPSDRQYVQGGHEKYFFKMHS